MRDHSISNEMMCMQKTMRVVNDCIVHLCMPESVSF